MYDLIVIGSGPAGEKGAAQAAYFGKRVALIEREAMPGGACVNTGTIPSKTLRESALHLSGFRQRGFTNAVEVHLIDARSSLLPHMDREIVRILLGEMQTRLGVILHLACEVQNVEKSGEKVSLTLRNGQCVVVDTVLHAAGRSSNVGDLNLEAVGVKTGNRGL